MNYDDDDDDDGSLYYYDGGDDDDFLKYCDDDDGDDDDFLKYCDDDDDDDGLLKVFSDVFLLMLNYICYLQSVRLNHKSHYLCLTFVYF